MEKFFLLLRYSIGSSTELPGSISDEEWMQIYQLAAMHSVLGVMLKGVDTCGMKPPFALLMQWIGDAENIKESNKKANATAVKVSKFFEDKGFRGCILKGQGNAVLYDVRCKKDDGRCYPLALLRTPGDIDIWLEGGREKIMEMVDELWAGQLVRYHHVEIPDVDGIPVEVHFFPSYMHASWRNTRLQEWFEEHSDEQFSNRVCLPNTNEQVCVPTVGFNVIYQLQHMFSHLFTEGFGLRQVVDYYFVLKAQNDGRDMIEDVRRTLRYLGLWKFAGAMIWVMKEVLHLDEKYMIAEPNEKEG